MFFMVGPLASQPIIGMSIRMLPLLWIFYPITFSLPSKADAGKRFLFWEVDIEDSSCRQWMFKDMFNNCANIFFCYLIVRLGKVGARKGYARDIAQGPFNHAANCSAIHCGATGICSFVDPRNDQIGSMVENDAHP